MRTIQSNTQLSRLEGATVMLIEAENEHPDIVDRWINKPLHVVRSKQNNTNFALFYPYATCHMFDTLIPTFPIKITVL